MFLVKPQQDSSSMDVCTSTRSSSTHRRRSNSVGCLLVRDSEIPLNGKDWKYVAEGGANVLFRHRNATSTKEFQGKLLRVKKCDLGLEDQQQRKKPAYYPDPQQVLQYATEEILPYLEKQLVDNEEENEYKDHSQESINTSYLQVAQLLQVEKEFLMQLNDQLIHLETRPSHRQKSQIDISLECVMVLPDVTLPSPEPPASASGSESASASSTCQNFAPMFSTVSPAPPPPLAPVSSFIPTSLSATSFVTPGEGFDVLNEEVKQLMKDICVQQHHDKKEQKDKKRDSPLNVEDFDVEEEQIHHSSSSSSSSVIASRFLNSFPHLRRVLSNTTHRNIFDCCFSNICVEIKPKIGFKPKGKLISSIKKQVCRFCMHQHYKQAAGKVEEISEYCPLDLFSKDPNRMRKALKALQRTPQNNFKVFVRSSEDEVVNVITGLRGDALPKGASLNCQRKKLGFRRSCHSIGSENDVAEEKQQVNGDLVELMTEVLLKLSVLEDLRKMQLLDHINVEGVWQLQQLLQALKRRTIVKESRLDELIEKHFNEDQRKELDLERCIEFLEYAINQVPDLEVLENISSWKQLTLEAFEEFHRHIIQRFQVATTLKDCSILLCLRRSDTDINSSTASRGMTCTADPGGVEAKICGVPEGRKKFEHLREFEHPIAFRNMSFDCVLAVVDLDVKSHKSVTDYYTLDQKIVDNYMKKFQERLDENWCYED